MIQINSIYFYSCVLLLSYIFYMWKAKLHSFDIFSFILKTREEKGEKGFFFFFMSFMLTHIITPLMLFISLWQFSYYLLLFHCSLKDFGTVIFFVWCMCAHNKLLSLCLSWNVFILPLFCWTKNSWLTVFFFQDF